MKKTEPRKPSTTRKRKTKTVRKKRTQRESVQSKKYHDYMNSDAWQKVRAKRLKIDGFVCQKCGSGINLQVHHITYEHLGRKGEINDLITLCRTCHKTVHAVDLQRKERKS